MDNWHEHINDYMDGTLVGEDLTAFEGEIKVNASLRAAISNYQDAKSISEGLLEVDMKETLDRLQNSAAETQNHSSDITYRSHDSDSHSQLVKSKGGSSIFNLRTLVASAAVIVGVVIAGWWMMTVLEDAQRKEYVQAQIPKLRDDDATKSVDTVGMSPFEKGKHFYSLNNYPESIKWLKLTVEGDGGEELKSEGYFWLGHAYIRVWRVDEARKAWEMSDEEGVAEYLETLSKK